MSREPGVGPLPLMRGRRDQEEIVQADVREDPVTRRQRLLQHPEERLFAAAEEVALDLHGQVIRNVGARSCGGLLQAGGDSLSLAP